MNEDGDWVVVDDENENAIENLSENHGGGLARVVKLTVKMRAPVAAEIEVTIPDDAGETVSPQIQVTTEAA